MNKVFYKQSLLLVLITALLSLQWSSAHIHLESQHKHDGSHHQHTVTAHNHQSSTHHQSAIDITDNHHINDFVSHDEYSVVKLEKTFVVFNIKQIYKLPVFVAAIETQCNDLNNSGINLYPHTRIFFNQYLENTSIRLRAPPYIL